MNRRTFIQRTVLAGVGLAGLSGIDACLLEPRWLKVERLTVPIRNLPAAFEGFRAVLISDTHCCGNVPPARVRKAVELANAEAPDAVLLLGDYGWGEYIAPGIEPFADLNAKEGVFAVLGNHDHWQGGGHFKHALDRAGAVELTNRGVLLARGADRLALGGIDDLWEGEQHPAVAFENVPPDVPRLLMSHNPEYAEILPGDVRVDLMLSGHSHGGQVVLPLIGAPILPLRCGQKYRAGLVQGPTCRVYVTRGVGSIPPHVRFLCRPEVTVLTLTRA